MLDVEVEVEVEVEMHLFVVLKSEARTVYSSKGFANTHIQEILK